MIVNFKWIITRKAMGTKEELNPTISISEFDTTIKGGC